MGPVAFGARACDGPAVHRTVVQRESPEQIVLAIQARLGEQAVRLLQVERGQNPEGWRHLHRALSAELGAILACAARQAQVAIDGAGARVLAERRPESLEEVRGARARHEEAHRAGRCASPAPRRPPVVPRDPAVEARLRAGLCAFWRAELEREPHVLVPLMWIVASELGVLECHILMAAPTWRRPAMLVEVEEEVMRLADEVIEAEGFPAEAGDGAEPEVRPAGAG